MRTRIGRRERRTELRPLRVTAAVLGLVAMVPLGWLLARDVHEQREIWCDSGREAVVAAGQPSGSDYRTSFDLSRLHYVCEVVPVGAAAPPEETDIPWSCLLPIPFTTCRWPDLGDPAATHG